MKNKILTIILIIVLSILFTSCAKNQKHTETVSCMDTIVTVTCYSQDAETARSAAKAATDEIRRIEFLLSAHIEGSEVYEINRNAYVAPVKLSEETEYVLQKALDICQKTNGAFDITIKPLVELWNIKSENPVVPEEDAINAAKEKVDYKSVEIKDGYISFKKEGMKIDLGGAAKGYAADCAVRVLKQCGIQNAILDLGGNVYAMGKSESGKAWKIGLQKPDGERGEHFSVEELSDKTCVTSGSYERYFKKDGKIYHHIINPETGFPADSGLISVSVVGDSSFEADMLSTAIFVMGEKNFNEIKEKFNFDSYTVVDKTNRHRKYS